MFKNEEGFSLLELVVAVGVAGIIAAVALPTFAGLQDKATTTSATYAASASAAEALANSTIGNTGGNGTTSNNSSYTGGSSSSSSSTSNTIFSGATNWYGSGGQGGPLNIEIYSITSVSQDMIDNPQNYIITITGGNYAGSSTLSRVYLAPMGPWLVVQASNNWVGMMGFGMFGVSGSGQVPTGDSGVISISHI